jgi:hypothetical protein
MAISRRHALATLGISASAGCLGNIPFPSESGIRLGSIGVFNGYEPQTIDLELVREGEVVFEDTLELDTDDQRIIDPSWSTEPAEYTFSYSNGFEEEKSLTAEYHSARTDECNFLWLMYYSDGDRAVLMDTNEPDWGTC